MPTQIQWLAHSAFMLDIDGHKVLIDPFIEGNPLATISPNDLSPELILLSHAHGDHLGDTVSIATANSAPVVTCFEIANWLSSNGVNETIGMNPGGQYDFGYMTVKCTRANHSSSFPDGSYGGVAMGFVITIASSGQVIYFAGDTDLFSDMALIGEVGVNMAILPIGDHFTMGVDDSIRAIGMVKPDVVLPMHYNTFPPIAQDGGAWANRVNSETDAHPVVLDPGGTYTLE